MTFTEIKKDCIVCKLSLPITCFHKNSNKKDSLQTSCIDCKNNYRANSNGAYKQRAFEYRTENADKIKARCKNYYEKNKEAHKARAKRFKDSNPEWHSTYAKVRRKTDIQFKLQDVIRRRLRTSLGVIKGGITNLLKTKGSTAYEIQIHLESLFKEGMTWNNHGEWHVDHVKPLKLFDLTDPEEVLKATHYSNLQPLWASENLKKGSRYDGRESHEAS